MPGGVTLSEEKMAEYLIGYLEEPCDDRAIDAAWRAASRTGHHEKQRILDCLKTNHSLRDSSRTGPTCYYTDEIMQQAESMLLDDTTGMLTGEQLYTQCVEASILRAKSDKDHY